MYADRETFRRTPSTLTPSGNDFIRELLKGNKRETAETTRCITINSVALSGSLPFS